MIDRSEVSRTLAKVISYKQYGRDVEARCAARNLIYLLECAEILAPPQAKP